MTLGEAFEAGWKEAAFFERRPGFVPNGDPMKAQVHPYDVPGLKGRCVYANLHGSDKSFRRVFLIAPEA